MVKDSNLYVQEDKKWGHLLWYDKKIFEALKRVTKALHFYAEHSNSGQKLINATQNFCSLINEIVSSAAYHQTTRKAGSLAKSGCWHTSIANMLTAFEVSLNGNHVTPPILLKALQDSMMGTLTGYVEHPFIDPLSIITEGRVQLSRYRDFGRKGVGRNDTDLLDLLSTANGRTVCAIVNVNEHEFLGDGDSHYVLVKGPIDGDYEMLDPGSPNKSRLFREYSKTRFKQVSVYQNFTG
jgi:hypothetical protein